MHKLCIHIEGDRRDRGTDRRGASTHHPASPPSHPPSTSVPKKYSLVVFPLS